MSEIAQPVVELRNAVFPLKSNLPQDNLTDLSPLKALIGDAHIVAIGEATHGTKEFMLMRHRLLKFLIEEMGFSHLALEASWDQCSRINTYIQAGEGDPQTLVKELYWVYRTQEFVEVITWLRQYNEQHSNIISFFGLDMQSFSLASEAVKAYVASFLPQELSEVEASLALLSRLPLRIKLSPQEKRSCRSCLQKLYTRLSEDESQFGDALSSRALVHVRQSLRILMQAECVFSGEDSSARDRFMATNLASILDEAGPETKIIVWAHNEHIGNAEYRLPNTTFRSMGSYLREWYQTDYRAIALSFYQGTCYAIEGNDALARSSLLVAHRVLPPPEQSYEYLFNQVGPARWLLDFQQVDPAGAAARWLEGPRLFRFIGALYREDQPQIFFCQASLRREFDGAIFLRDTSAVQTLVLHARRTDQDDQGQNVLSPYPTNLDFTTKLVGWELTGSKQAYEVGIEQEYIYLRSKEAGDTKGCTLAQSFLAHYYRRKRLRFSALVQAEGIVGGAQIWLRVGNHKHSLCFMRRPAPPLQGSCAWTAYEIIKDIQEESTNITIGFFLCGTGQFRFKQARLEIIE
ncbi:erythromycin esterase family protein [Ktedonosporobacter rubrisoli]|uniref:Erythromycin esterase family protein n=1 Tax=Ktedonosporobacter rubrisoli TaxID=2509675 RepID=A0A4P6JLQ8_KTERU|nr:erythromycin esterase family protein [Ktedonosporobacter rubrisoli]QBD76158.1 erythromycin esterase family protein [Ktedonosporobacter rubrisoli]